MEGNEFLEAALQAGALNAADVPAVAARGEELVRPRAVHAARLEPGSVRGGGAARAAGGGADHGRGRGRGRGQCRRRRRVGG